MSEYVTSWMSPVEPSGKRLYLPRRAKYRNVRVRVDGYTFDSKAEAARYFVLKALQETGAISGLTIHPRYPLEVNGRKICVYIADFAYLDLGKRPPLVVVEDVKSSVTRRLPAYRLKNKLFEAVMQRPITEILLDVAETVYQPIARGMCAAR